MCVRVCVYMTIYVCVSTGTISCVLTLTFPSSLDMAVQRDIIALQNTIF